MISLHKYLLGIMSLWIGTVNTNQALKEDINVLEDISMRERQLLKHWCPSVDICDQNATTADLKLNGKLDKDRISCCTGCSCHPDCKERLNCCYHDHDVNVGHNVISNSTFKYKCLHSRLFNDTDGQTDELITDRAPSYVTVTRPPVRGCVDTTPFRINDDVLVHPTCDNVDVTPWGSYFPVYSKSVDKIYNNVLCARCHGVTDTEYFTSRLICKKFDIELKQFTSLTQHAQTITSGIITKHCYVDFRYEHPYDISNKLCYVNDVIDTCQTTDRIQEHIDKINMTANELRELCEAGINAPLRDANVVYKNVFCYLCRERFVATCKTDGDIRQTKTTFIYLLNPDILLDHNNNLAKPQRPLVTRCLTNKQDSRDTICRVLHCPSGKIHNSNGDCILVSQEWTPGGHLMNIKLTPTNDKFLKTLEKAAMVELGINLVQNSPWAPRWTLISMYVREDTTVCDERAQYFVILLADTTKPNHIYRDVRKTVEEPWVAEMNGTTIEFQQSFLEYATNTDAIGYNLYPQWQWEKLNYIASDGKYFGCGPLVWKRIYSFKKRTRVSRPGKITKLFFCEQIQLEPDEYQLEHDMTYLRSNLTAGVLHADEFELVQDSDGIIHARVCLMDTAFNETRSNGARPRLMTPLVWYFVIVAECLYTISP